MAVDYRIISIGTLSHNLLWQEAKAVRTPCATTTLVATDDRWILVDPSLPANLLDAQMFARTGKRLDRVTDVFCTTLRPDARRALDGLTNANWWCGETELEWYGLKLEELADTAERLDSDDQVGVEKELDILRRFKPAPEKFDELVTVYPLAGATPGCSGLLLTPPTQTVVVAGPAALTREHIDRGMIWDECTDQELAMASLSDLLELADIIVPGFDNITFNPTRWI